jgi:hypothetical protein
MAVRTQRRLRSKAKSLFTLDITTQTCLNSVSAQPDYQGIEGLPMFGYFLTSAVVVVLTWAIAVGGGIIITRLDSENAAEIISAVGKSFPIKGGLWNRRS